MKTPYYIKQMIMLMILGSVISICQGQIKADFKADPIEGCAPIVVDFVDLSTGNPVSWYWDLGNGTTAEVKNPSATYFIPGTYTIRLIVKNRTGDSSEITKTKYINITTKPVVDFEANVTEACMPVVIKFKDLTDAKNGVLVKWEWDFGDGNVGTGKNPSINYQKDGVYNVTLRATNDRGCINSKTKLSYIKVNPKPVADFSADIIEACSAPDTINFTNLSSNKGMLKYEWSFGDNEISSDINPVHIYKNLKSYTVGLRISNEFGCSDTLVKKSYITLGKIKANFSAPEASCRGKYIPFTNTTKSDVESIRWDFGDNTFSTETNPTKSYSSSGVYSVKMKVTSKDGCADSIVKQIEIKDTLDLNFTASPLLACKAPLKVNFQNLSPGSNTYTWRFGDNAESNVKNPTHTYTTEGSFTVTLIGKSPTGCTDSISKSDIVYVGLPVPSINVPAGGCAPFTHRFKASFNPEFKISNYVWNFGDNGSSSVPSPTHTFKSVGNFDVSLIYTTSDGCTDTLKIDDAIRVGSKPKVDFSAKPLVACAKVPVFFKDLSTELIDSTAWIWDFGDGIKSDLQNPQHIYEDTGKFDVKLIVINNGCVDSLIFPKYIQIQPPIANFNYKQNCSTSGKIQFTDKSIGADKWHWDFGDGQTSDIKNPANVYAEGGTYMVSLTVTNKKTGCDFTKKMSILVIDEIPDFTVEATENCKNTPVKFTVKDVNPANIKTYTWNFGDGDSRSVNGILASHTYTVANNYNVSLTLRDNNNCSTTVEKPLFVKIYGPTIAFRAVNPVVCKNEVVTFFDSSYTESSGDIIKWEWKFGDKSSGTFSSAPFDHRYTDTGSYAVSLKVTDEKGCTDSVNKPKLVKVPFVKADFFADSLSCTYQTVNFQNLSKGEGLTYLWNFGDDSTSIEKNIKHKYEAEGAYSISLFVTDKYGCESDTSQSNLITILDPVADFSIDNGASNCPPLIVAFQNNSQHYASLEWNFGDGTKSNILNPSHFYGSVGEFNAVLKVQSGKGCVATDTVTIAVKGPSGVFSYDKLEGCVPVVTRFTAKAKGSDSFIWDFNDGNTVTTNNASITHEYNVRGFYEPRMILVDADGCRVPILGSDTIRVYGIDAAFVSDTNRICDLESIHFKNQTHTNDEILSYTWNFGDGEISGERDPAHAYFKTGNFNTSLIVKTKKGCQGSYKETIPIEVVKTPEIAIRGSFQSCISGNLNFAGLLLKSDASPVSWKWDFGNGQTANVQNPISQTYPAGGKYTVRTVGLSNNGCSDTASQLVEIFPLPVLKLSNDQVICLNQSTTITVSGALNFAWSPSATLSCADCGSPIASPGTSVQYKVTGISKEGCISEDSVHIEVKQPFRLTVNANDFLCIGKTTQLFVSGAEEYSWYPTVNISDPLSASPIVSPITNTNYRVIGRDSKGCFTDTAYVPIKVYDYPTVNAGADKTINVGTEVGIIPVVSKDATSVLWTPSTGISGTDGNMIIVKPTETTKYRITVKNDGGCAAVDEVTIFVVCNNTNVFVPNTFSPNGDGVNDFFFPRGTGVFKIKNLRIFNRWGQVVFDKSNFMANEATSGWDGTFKGKKLPADVFVYTLDVICENNEVLTFKGDVTLLR